MARSQLRVFYGPETGRAAVANRKSDESVVSVSLGEVLPMLADAHRSDRTWLRDFAREEISISADLYEVLLAYQHYRRPSA